MHDGARLDTETRIGRRYRHHSALTVACVILVVVDTRSVITSKGVATVSGSKPGVHDGETMRRSLQEPSAFCDVYSRHFHHIFAYCVAHVGRTRAEDVAQDVFLVAFTHRAAFEFDRDDARPRLCGIARHLCSRHFRSRHPIQLLTRKVPPPHGWRVRHSGRRARGRTAPSNSPLGSNIRSATVPGGNTDPARGERPGPQGNRCPARYQGRNRKVPTLASEGTYPQVLGQRNPRSGPKPKRRYGTQNGSCGNAQ